MSQSGRAKFKIAEAEVYDPATDAFLGRVRAYNANVPAWEAHSVFHSEAKPGFENANEAADWLVDEADRRNVHAGHEEVGTDGEDSHDEHPPPGSGDAR